MTRRTLLLAFLLSMFAPSARADDPPTFVLAWGSYGTGNGQFSIPMDLAVGAEGVYVVEYAPVNRVQQFTFDGQFVRTWGSTGQAYGQFEYARGLGIDDRTGDVYVTDLNNSIQRFASDGAFQAIWLLNFLCSSVGVQPSDVDIRSSNVPLFTNDRGVNGLVHCMNAAFRMSCAGISTQATAVAMVPDQACPDFFVTDGPNHRVLKFAGHGGLYFSFGSYGSGDGQFFAPQGLVVDPAGNVYVVDTLNHRVQKFAGNGTFLAKWGSQGAGSGQFQSPTSVGIDPAGNIYVLDQYNYRVQKFAPPTSSLPEPNGAVSHHGGAAPNPFGPETMIRYTAPAGGGRVRIEIFDMRGRLLRILKDGFAPAGEQAVTWDGHDEGGVAVSSGSYTYRLQIGGESRSGKLTLMR